MKLLDLALDLIFPPMCGMCKKIGEGYICNSCYQDIKPYLNQTIQNNVFYLLNYKDIVRNKMLNYKFNDQAYLYQMFCEIFVKSEIGCEFIKNYDIIIPVPMYKKKKAHRGYNQSELIAKELSKYFKISIDKDILIKQINTQMQSSLGKEERIQNVKNVYKVQYQERIIGKKVLLIDDIYTTGATVSECKKVLQLAGSKKVGTIIIAKD